MTKHRGGLGLIGAESAGPKADILDDMVLAEIAAALGVSPAALIDGAAMGRSNTRPELISGLSEACRSLDDPVRSKILEMVRTLTAKARR